MSLLDHLVRARAAWLLMAALVAVSIALSPRAHAQEIEELIEEGAAPNLKLLGEGGFVYQGKSDLDGGGNMEVFRYDLGLAARTQLMERLRWTNTLGFGVNDYDFGGAEFSTGSPWGTILNLRLGTKLAYALNDTWGIAAGGVFIFSPETGADWGDSFSGGGMVDVEYKHSDTLFLSLGVAVITQIEDDVRVVPDVGMRWLPADRWIVRVGAVPASGGAGAAAEVAYRVIEPVEIGLGALYHQRRFRLDDSGVVPEGVGEDNTLPVRLRVGWDVIENVSLNVLGGAALAGELELDDRGGNRIGKDDYDPAAYVGVRLIGGF